MSKKLRLVLECRFIKKLTLMKSEFFIIRPYITISECSLSTARARDSRDIFARDRVLVVGISTRARESVIIRAFGSIPYASSDRALRVRSALIWAPMISSWGSVGIYRYLWSFTYRVYHIYLTSSKNMKTKIKIRTRVFSKVALSLSDA